MKPRRPHIALLLVLTTAAAVTTGCAPSAVPLYADYDVQPAEDDIMARIERALVAADWKVYPGETPNVLATDTITVGTRVLYNIEVSLEVAPLGGNHVRVFVHPYRKYIGGARRKVRYFRGGLQSAILPRLNESFSAEGLTPVGLKD